MRHRLWTRGGIGRLALVVSVLAVLARLAAGVAPVPAEDWFAALQGGSICHAPGSEGTGGSDSSGHGAGIDCGLCPACLTAAPVLADAPPVPRLVRAVFAVRYVLPPPGRGPPTPAHAEARPRGPPGLV